MKEDVMGKRLIKIPLGSAFDLSTAKDIETLKNDLDAMGVSLAVSGSERWFLNTIAKLISVMRAGRRRLFRKTARLQGWLQNNWTSGF